MKMMLLPLLVVILVAQSQAIAVADAAEDPAMIVPRAYELRREQDKLRQANLVENDAEGSSDDGTVEEDLSSSNSTTEGSRGSYSLDLRGATAACKAMKDSRNWSWKINDRRVDMVGMKSLICTSHLSNWDDACAGCANWRLLVWSDGGKDMGQYTRGQTYYTKAGRSYGGHSPCRSGWNLPDCNKPWTTVGQKASAKYKEMPEGQHCSSPLTSSTECKEAAKQLGFTYGATINGVGDYPGCWLANDGRNKFYYNFSHLASKTANKNKAAICK